MAINWKRTRPQEQAFAMAPMVDMVFLLLVFFMCVTAISGGRAGVRIPLPQTGAANASAAGATDTRKAQIVLSLAEGGALTVNGILCEPVELLPLLRRMRAEANGEISVRVRAHANAPYRQIDPLLAACSMAGITKVSYAAFEADFESVSAMNAVKLESARVADAVEFESVSAANGSRSESDRVAGGEGGAQ